MPRKGIFLFATKSDMVPGLEILEDALEFKYIVPGLFDSSEVIEYSSYKELPNFGVSEKGSVEIMPRYHLFQLILKLLQWKFRREKVVLSSKWIPMFVYISSHPEPIKIAFLYRASFLQEKVSSHQICTSCSVKSLQKNITKLMHTALVLRHIKSFNLVYRSHQATTLNQRCTYSVNKGQQRTVKKVT